MSMKKKAFFIHILFIIIFNKLYLCYYKEITYTIKNTLSTILFFSILKLCFQKNVLKFESLI